MSPLKTVLELKQLRDLIAHGKSEKITGTVVHSDDTLAASPESALRQMIVPREKLSSVISDVAQFIQSIHERAVPNVKDKRLAATLCVVRRKYTVYGTTLHRDRT